MNRSDAYCGVRDAGRWTRIGNPVLMYHKLGHAPLTARLRALYVSPRLFRAQLAELLRLGRKAVPPGAAGRTAGSFGITLDDGFESALRLGLPILTALGVSATLYLVADRLGGWNDWDAGEPRERLLDASQVRDWLAAGQRIGSHTLTHPRLPELSDAAATEELRASRARLEDLFGLEVTDFCYPYGAHDARIRALTAAAGYTNAVTVVPGTATAGTDPLTIPRLLARHRWPGPGAVLSRALALFSRP